MQRGHTLWFLLVVAGFIAPALAQQTTDFVITDFPIGVRNGDDTLTVSWTGNLRFPPDPDILAAPDHGNIYFDRNPGGSDLHNYRYQVKPVVVTDSVTGLPLILQNVYVPGYPPQRLTKFIPQEQSNMDGGVYYCVVALPLDNDTLVSNEFMVIVQSQEPVTMTGPVGEIEELTPTFTWEPNPGVPYYHIILSDKEIDFEDSAGISIVWQAITPDNEITYGAPDPSGTITADPPPLSPGQRYTWIVLNNYYNQLAFSSYVINKPLGFSVGGDSLKAPVNVFPSPRLQYPGRVDTLNNVDNPTITFEWSNLDSGANTYQVYVYVGADFEGASAQVVVWEGEVMAGQFHGQSTASINVDAASVLTSNLYSWRVFAVDDQGAGTAGEITQFRYNSPQGTISVATRERITAGSDTLNTGVGLVEISVDVLDGSLEAPLAFYTDLNGDLSRDRPVGSYRLTAIKDGFESQSRTVTLAENATESVTFYLERPEATVYGQVVDKTGQGVNLAQVFGVSDRGDTVSTESDARGNFRLNTYGADWTFWTEKVGYVATVPFDTTVESGASFYAGTMTLVQNPLSLSGTVVNGDGGPVLGVAIRVYRDGTLLQEIPATPQTGAYQFNLTAGEYRIEATKTGFSTFSTQVQMSGSKQLAISMAAGAFLVKGYVYGVSWVGANRKVAPITGATVTFVPVDGGDTVPVETHQQYGDFTVSLPGDGREYKVYSSASDFKAVEQAITLTTRPDTTYNFSDTLEAYATVSGRAQRSSTGAGEGGVTIALVDTNSGVAVRTVRTASDGSYEMGGIPDGAYLLSAGKEELQTDSVSALGQLAVSGGRPSTDLFTVYMSPGDRNVRWRVDNGNDRTATIKLQSPLVKTLKVADTLKNVGVGTYAVTIDAVDKSVLDLAHHSFTVQASDADPYVDNVSLPVHHAVPASVVPVRDTIQLVLESDVEVDSAVLYYRDVTAAAFFRTSKRVKADTYTFAIRPPRDGSSLRYYFKAYLNGDVYGYEQELFTTYVKPDAQTLSKYTVLPSGDDTLTFPSSAVLTFTFKGYYSSAFIPADSVLYDTMIQSWQLIDAQGCKFEKGDTSGLSVTIRTPRSKTENLVKLVVTVNTNRIGLKAGVQSSDTVAFIVSGSELDSVVVKRLDGTGVIANSNESRASFRADGLSKDGKQVALSPLWRVVPSMAGTIDELGTFTPSTSFFGRARIIAETGSVSGDFISANGKVGLAVGFLLTTRNRPDTASNGRGCTIIFPDSVVQGGDVGLVTLEEPVLANLVARGYGKTFVSGTVYDIKETKNIRLNAGEDSILLKLDIQGEAMQTKVANNPTGFFAARWDTAQYKWQALPNSFVDPGGQWVSARLGSFSRYAVGDTIGKLSGELGISPNPFSPYVQPRGGSRQGACLYFSVDAQESNLEYAWVKIYNMVNDVVYSVKVSPVSKGAYTLWWDGKTTERTQHINGGDLVAGDYSNLKTSRMCRNGRYYVVLTVRDLGGKEKQYMKPVVILK